MGVVIKQSLYSTIISYIGVILGFVNNILLFPLVLSLTEIGLVKLFSSFALMATPLLHLGGIHLTVKYSERLKDPLESNRFLSFVFYIIIIGIILFSVLFILFKDEIANAFDQKSPLFNDYIWWAIPISIFFMLGGFLQVLISIKLKNVFSTFMKDIFIRVVTIGALMLYFTDWIDQEGFIQLYILLWGVQVIFLFVYFFKLFKPKFLSPKKAFQVSDKKSLYKYLFFIILGSAGGGVVTQIDSLMSSSKLGLSYTGIYTIAFYIAILIEIPKRAILRVISPLISKAFQENKIEKVDELYKQSATNQYIIGLLFFLLIFFNIEHIYYFIPSVDKEQMLTLGYPVVIIIGLSKLFDMLMGCNAEIIQYSKYYWFSAILVPCLALTAIATNILFLDYLKMDLMGIAFATFISIALYNIVRGFLIWKYLNLSPFRWAHLKITFLGAGVIALGVLILPSINVYVDIILHSIFVLIVFITPIIAFKLSPEIHQEYLKIIKKLTKKE